MIMRNFRNRFEHYHKSHSDRYPPQICLLQTEYELAQGPKELVPYVLQLLIS